MGRSIKSHFNLRNSTRCNLTLKVSDVSSFDWDGRSRPDHNLHRKTVRPGTFVYEREELNKAATSHMMTLKLQFSDGNHLYLRIDQGLAIHDDTTWIDDVVSSARDSPMDEGNGSNIINGSILIADLFRRIFSHHEAGKFKVYGNTSDKYYVRHYIENSTLYIHVCER